MHQVAIDIEQRRAVFLDVHRVRLPELVVKRARDHSARCPKTKLYRINHTENFICSPKEVFSTPPRRDQAPRYPPRIMPAPTDPRPTIRMSRIPRSVFFLLFTVSGFAGLIYESIWSHYLKLFLGHAAYAQTLVLALFMGGMAIGSWLCSRWSAGWGNLLRGYALAEGLIGLAALAFHPVFVAATDAAYASIMPALGGEIPATLFKWTLAEIGRAHV